MNAQDVLESLGPYAATLIVGFLGALFPVVNIEVFLLAAGAIASGSYPVWTLGVVAGFGQMGGKCILYWIARAAVNSQAGRRHSSERADGLRRRMGAMSPWMLSGFNFVSALTGVPPFMLVSIIAGVIEMKFWQFAATGLTGRVVRLVAIVTFPQAIKGLFIE
jgi:membrane protein YqaA with SNARE-associated domain